MAEDVVDDGFSINARRVDPDVVLVTITGDLDTRTVPQATAFLDQATTIPPHHLVLDLSEVRFLASSGISLLLNAQLDADGIRDRLHLLGVTDNRAVHRPLALIGLLDRFDVAADLDTVLARLDTITPRTAGEPLAD